MTDIDAAAAFSAAQAQSQVGTQIGIKVLKMINQQQQSVLSLVDAAAQAAQQIQQSGHVDIQG